MRLPAIKASLSAAATPLIALVALSLAIKGAAAFFGTTVNPDGVRYINAAHAFQTGNFRLGLAYVGDMPFYPLLLAAMQSIIPDWVLAGQILSIAGLSLAVIPLYLLTRQLFGPLAALFSGLAFVFSPVLNEYSAEVLRDPLFLCFFLWAAWFGRQALLNFTFLHFVSASAMAFLATLMRIEGVLFFPVFFTALLVSAWHRDRLKGTLLRGAALMMVPAVILLFLVFPFQQEVKNVFTGSHGVGLFAQDLMRLNLLGTYPEVYSSLKAWESTLPNAQWNRDISEIVRQNLPLIYLLGLVQAFFSAMYPLFVPLALMGLILAPVQGKGRLFFLSLIAIFVAAAYFVLFHRNFLSDRYLLAPTVLFLPWVGVGTEYLMQQCRRSNRAWSVPLLAVVVIALPIWSTASHFGGKGEALKQAGQWLASEKDFQEVRLICNDERVPFYAGRWREHYTMVPTRDPEELTRIALSEGAMLIVMENSAKKQPPAIPSGFFRLAEFVDGKNRVVIFQRQP